MSKHDTLLLCVPTVIFFLSHQTFEVFNMLYRINYEVVERHARMFLFCVLLLIVVALGRVADASAVAVVVCRWCM